MMIQKNHILFIGGNTIDHKRPIIDGRLILSYERLFAGDKARLCPLKDCDRLFVGKIYLPGGLNCVLNCCYVILYRICYISMQIL